MQKINNIFFGGLVLLILISLLKDCDNCFSFSDPINGNTLFLLSSLTNNRAILVLVSIAINSSFSDLSVQPNNSDDDLEKINNF